MGRTWPVTKVIFAAKVRFYPLQTLGGLRGTTPAAPLMSCYNTGMTHLRRSVIFGLFACLAVAVAQNTQEKPPTATLNMVIVRESGGKPVKNAEVVLHLLDKEGRMKQDGLELKTHEDGKADASGIPYGKVRIQVIAHGFRTWGQDYDVAQPSMAITIKLQKPAGQFSIYK